MKARLMAIEKEIRRCKDELKNEKLKTAESAMNAELRALESEIFGPDSKRRAMQKKKRLGALGYTNDELGNTSYYHICDGPFHLSTANELVSCQSGGMYGEIEKYSRFVDKDVNFYRKEYTATRGNKTFTLIVHKTNNKNNEMEACAISVFQGQRFIAYLFSTNDPLSFDNFNCYRGEAGPSDKPQKKCVEQMVFCEAKVLINLHIVQKQGRNVLFEEAMKSKFVTHKLLTKLANKLGLGTTLNAHLNAIKKTFLSNCAKANENELTNVEKDTLNKELTRTAKEVVNGWEDKEEKLYGAYLEYFQEKLHLKPHLVPFDEYKSVGRELIAVGNYLEEWDAVSMMCVLSARMQQLFWSKAERSLVAALVPVCIAECSNDDSIWAYVMNESKKDKLTWLTTSTRYPKLDNEDRLFEIIDDATRFQNRYIELLDEYISNEKYTDAYNLLFGQDRYVNELIRGPLPDGLSALQTLDQKNIHKLGLSERLIQALWTGQIKFPQTLVDMITERLAKYNIVYCTSMPEIRVESTLNALTIIQNIGISK